MPDQPGISALKAPGTHIGRPFGARQGAERIAQGQPGCRPSQQQPEGQDGDEEDSFHGAILAEPPSALRQITPYQ